MAICCDFLGLEVQPEPEAAQWSASRRADLKSKCRAAVPTITFIVPPHFSLCGIERINLAGGRPK